MILMIILAGKYLIISVQNQHSPIKGQNTSRQSGSWIAHFWRYCRCYRPEQHACQPGRPKNCDQRRMRSEDDVFESVEKRIKNQKKQILLLHSWIYQKHHYLCSCITVQPRYEQTVHV